MGKNPKKKTNDYQKQKPNSNFQSPSSPEHSQREEQSVLKVNLKQTIKPADIQLSRQEIELLDIINYYWVDNTKVENAIFEFEKGSAAQAKEDFKALLEIIERDLTHLLSFDFVKFWSHIIYNPNVKNFLDIFINNARKTLDFKESSATKSKTTKDIAEGREVTEVYENILRYF